MAIVSRYGGSVYSNCSLAASVTRAVILKEKNVHASFECIKGIHKEAQDEMIPSGQVKYICTALFTRLFQSSFTENNDVNIIMPYSHLIDKAGKKCG